MAFSMADSLSLGVADYTTTELNVTPQRVLPIAASKNQELLFTDDENPLVINIEDTTVYRVDLIFNHITLADADTLMDFWIDTSKANGMENTFYWRHPTDGYTYVARFISNPTHQVYGGISTHEGVLNVRLYINARKDTSALLLEDGDYLLQEDGTSKILTE